MNARELTRALGGKWTGASGAARCPAHDDRSPSLSISDSDGRVLVCCHAGCDQAAVINALRARGLWPDRADVSRGTPHRRAPRDGGADQSAERRSEGARVIWRRAVAVAGTPAEQYLRGRGLRPGPDGWPATLRFHSGLKHQSSGLVLSALVAAVGVWPGTQVVAVQRVFLKSGTGEQIVAAKPKMSLGPCRGGAARLAPAGETLALAEGVETGLAVQQATGLPTWAVLGASNLKTVIPPPFVRELVIAADGDAAGRAAAQAAGERWAQVGYRVRVADPGDGVDWLDVLNRGSYE